MATSTSSSAQSRFAVRLFLAVVGVFGLAGLLAVGLISAGDGWDPAGGTPSLRVFLLTTVLLLAGSLALHRAVGCVRREKQSPFRHSLIAALAAGTLFVGVQSYALWRIVPRHGSAPAATDAAPAATAALPFLFVAVALHGLHFTVALAFLVFVALKGFANRYDHEYFWGVLVCAYFWHALGIAWIWILCALALVP